MRDYGAPRSKMRALRATDVVAHWLLSEVSGTVILDQGPEETDLASASPANVVDGPFIGEAATNYGRDTTTNNAAGASTALQRINIRDVDWTIELWMRPASTASTGTLLTLGVAGNYLVVVQAIAGAALRVQLGGTTDTMTGLWAAGDDVHVGIRRTITGATCMLEVFVNGLRVYMATGVALSTSTTTGGWTLGSSASATARFAGIIWEVRIAVLALPDEAIRESAARGFRDWSITRAIDSGEATVHRRVLVHDGLNGFVDISKLYGVDWARGWEESETVDDDGASGTVDLRQRNEWLSTSPWMASSRVNVAAPLGQMLDVRRRIKLEEAIVPAGVSRDEVGELHWGLVFDGWCRNVGGVEGETVKLALLDGAYPLQWAWAQPNRGTSPHTDFVYAAAPTPIEDVIRQILADHRPTAISGVVEGYGAGAAVELFVPSSPGFVVDNSPGVWTTTSSKSVMQTLLDLVDTTIAWHLRYRWDDTRQQFRLTLFDPGRGKTWTSGAPVLAQRNIRKWRRLEVDDADIRNDFEIEHNASGATDNLGVAGRAIYRVEHLASVGRFRRTYARLALSATSQLKTMGEVTNLGAMMVSDLAYPLADMELELPARRDIEIGDVVRIQPDDVRIDGAMDVAVVGISHTRRGRELTTTIQCRQAAPVGRRRRWFDRFTQRGINAGKGQTPPRTPAAPTLYPVPGGLLVGWTWPTGAGNRRYLETEVHVGSSSSFTPSPSTLVSLGRGINNAVVSLVGGVAVHVKILHRDSMGNVSVSSSSSPSTPRQLVRSAHARVRRSVNQVLAVSATPATIIWNVEDADPLARYNPATGEYTAAHDGLLRVRAWALFDSNAKPSATATLYIYVNGALVSSGVTGTCNAGAAPNRVQLTIEDELVVAAGDLVTVRIVASNGNPGQFVVASATGSRCWLTPTTED